MYDRMLYTIWSLCDVLRLSWDKIIYSSLRDPYTEHISVIRGNQVRYISNIEPRIIWHTLAFILLRKSVVLVQEPNFVPFLLEIDTEIFPFSKLTDTFSNFLHSYISKNMICVWEWFVNRCITSYFLSRNIPCNPFLYQQRNIGI